MTVIDRATAVAAAELIRDETGTNANTHTRIGNAFLDWAQSLLFSGPGADASERTIQVDGINSTALSGLTIYNSDPASAGVPAYAPALVMQGELWDEGSSARKEFYVRVQGRGVQGDPPLPQFAVSFDVATEGTAPDAASTTDALLFDVTGMRILGDADFIFTFGGLDSVLKTQGGTLIVGTSGAGGPVGIAFDTDDDGSISFAINAVGKMNVTETLISFTLGTAQTLAITDEQLSMASDSAITLGPTFQFTRNRDGGALLNGDYVGAHFYYGYDGGGLLLGARVVGAVDGDPGSGFMPLAVEIHTGSDGSTAKRVKVDSIGVVQIEDCDSAPTTGQGLYVESGELKWRGPSGAITPIGAA